MFELLATKLLIVLLVVVATLGTIWYLDTAYYHWDRLYLPEHEKTTHDTPVKIVLDAPEVDHAMSSDEAVPVLPEWRPPFVSGDELQRGDVETLNTATVVDDVDDDDDDDDIELSLDNSADTEPRDLGPRNRHEFKSFASLGGPHADVTGKSDEEIMDGLAEQFRQQIRAYEDSDQKLRNILTDLEYLLLYRIDETAQVFVDRKGVGTIIVPCIDSRSAYLKTHGALILGYAASNNRGIQVAALETDVVPLLLRQITGEQEFSVQKNCLYALSSLTKRFPPGLKRVVDEGGITTYASVFDRPVSEANAKLKLITVRLVEKSLADMEDAKARRNEELRDPHPRGDPRGRAEDAVRQYDELDFKGKLVENDWCEILSRQLVTLSDRLPTDEDDHHTVEASGKSLLSMDVLCASRLRDDAKLYRSLRALETYYKTLSHEVDTFNPLYRLMNILSITYEPTSSA